MNQPILHCENLCKSYVNGTPVLENLNLDVESGKITGLLGPNGCGKSTLIKMCAGLLTPTSGRIAIDGIPVGPDTKAMVSYLPERPYFNARMKVWQLMDYFSDFYADFDRAKAEAMLADLKVESKARMSTLSKGTKEKVQLVLVMARKAKLYILDEPIGGVDPAARDYILSTIVSNYSEGAAVVITTHLIADVERVLDDFVFLGYGGKLILLGSADEARAKTGKTLDEMFREVYRCSGNF